MVVIGLLASACSAATFEGEDAGTSATYSKGRNGSTLKWLPQRSAAKAVAKRGSDLPRISADTEVTPAGYTMPSESSRPELAAQTPTRKTPSSRFFAQTGEKRKSGVAAPAEKPSDDSSLQLSETPKLQGTTPKQKIDEPLEAEKPNVLPTELAPVKPSKMGNGGTKPLLEQEYAPQSHEPDDKCPSQKDLKPISELTTDITPPEGDLPKECPLIGEAFQQRSFSPVTVTWTASSLCHKPLYFEDVQLERYGHAVGPWVQPFASAANFFATFPILPYKMGLETPDECLYTLGYYRPGSCAPYLFDPIPLSVRGALFEAGTWVGGCYAVP
jgi:hypothetical protein